jgi:hypothetical protein
MIRKLSFLVLVTAFVVSACGRQVTPDRPGTNGTGIQSGFMQIKFRVAAPFDFAHVRYVIVFNTSGTGGTPYANAYITGYKDYSFAIVVGGNGSLAATQFFEYVRNVQGQPPFIQQLPTTPQQLVSNFNSNGQGTEFTLLIDRRLFAGTVTPSPSPTPSGTPTPTPSPSPTPTGSPSPSPSPTPGFATMWFFNFFTVDQTNIPVDALGQGGGQDVTFQGNLPDIGTVFDTTFFVPSGAVQAPMPTEQITGGEITNSP